MSAFLQPDSNLIPEGDSEDVEKILAPLDDDLPDGRGN